MTYTELQKKITHLEIELTEVKEKIAALPKRVDSGGVFQPEYGQEYWFISDKGGTFNSTWTDSWIEDYRYVIGNCFPNKQAAEDAIRVLKLTQKARETQNGFVPDWDDEGQDKCFLYFRMRDFGVADYLSTNIAPIFGYWEERSVCEQFIDENHDELIWFFTEYRR